MTLTAADVAEIMRLVDQSGFDELNLEIDGTKISLRRGASSDTPRDAGHVPVVPLAAARPARTSASAPALQGAADPAAVDLPSPLLGTFYRSPKPGAAPFVQVGSQVEPDTIIGIIEVMKLMNTVRAGVRGTVVELLAADGALVEFGEVLLRVRKTG
jgi:acetyl-CoA carboxylase biotin carboxyl carrier protein